MKKIRDASEDEMILVYLQEEIESERFSDDIIKVLETLGLHKDIICKGNIENSIENEQRKKILSLFRGYPDKEIFENYPKMARWEFVEFETSDLDKIYYIDYDYWNELSKGTSKPSEAAQSVYEGIEIFGVSNEPMFAAKKYLESGNFPPIIAYTCGNQKLLLLEGHKRMTVYGMLPQRFEGSFGYIGYCSKEEMAKKNIKMVE